jgi:phosphoglucomutase
VGKTLVSSAIIDRVGADRDRRVVEVPVGFKWFVDGLLDGSLGFGGEESAGASFLRRDGGPWTTDKDGLIPCLLAAEMNATTAGPGESTTSWPSASAARLPRTDVAATPEQKDVLSGSRPSRCRRRARPASRSEVLTEGPGNDAPIGG